MIKSLNKMTGDNLLDDTIRRLAIGPVNEVISEITKEELIELFNIQLTFPLSKDDRLSDTNFVTNELCIKCNDLDFQKTMLLPNPLWVSFFKLFTLSGDKAISLTKLYFDTVHKGVDKDTRLDFLYELSKVIEYDKSIPYSE